MGARHLNAVFDTSYKFVIIADLETVVLADRNYCVKVCADNDFSGIGAEFAALIKKLKKPVFIPAKKDYDHIKTMLSELSSVDGTTEVSVPSTFIEETPYFDVLDYTEDFKRIIPIFEKDWQLLKGRGRIPRNKMCVAASSYHTVGLKADGTVVAVGKNGDGQCNVSDWRGIGPVSKEQVKAMAERLERERLAKEQAEREAREAEAARNANPAAKKRTTDVTLIGILF